MERDLKMAEFELGFEWKAGGREERKGQFMLKRTARVKNTDN